MNINELLGNTGTQTQVHKGKGQQELGQKDFLKLLVTQMQNQDPVNPTDNSEFLSQITQFSMVDGIEGLGESFDGIAGSFFANQAMSASQLVGRQVLTESESSWLHEGQSLQGFVEIPEYADALNIQVRDMNGKLLKTIDSSEFTLGDYPFTWDGTDEQGELQNPAEYAITATALVEGKQQALPVKLYNTVESITLNRNGNNVQLQLDNNEQVSFSGVEEYR